MRTHCAGARHIAPTAAVRCAANTMCQTLDQKSYQNRGIAHINLGRSMSGLLRFWTAGCLGHRGCTAVGGVCAHAHVTHTRALLCASTCTVWDQINTCKQARSASGGDNCAFVTPEGLCVCHTCLACRPLPCHLKIKGQLPKNRPCHGCRFKTSHRKPR